MFNETNFEKLITAANLTKRFKADDNLVYDISIWDESETKWIKSQIKEELGYVEPLTPEVIALIEEAETLQAKMYDN